MTAERTTTEQEAFFRLLQLDPRTAPFWMQVDLRARCGSKFQLVAFRQSPKSYLIWHVYITGDKPLYACYHDKVQTNVLRLPPFRFGSAVEWLDLAATRLGSHWTRAPRTTVEDLDPKVKRTVANWLKPALQPSPAAKRVGDTPRGAEASGSRLKRHARPRPLEG